MDTASADDEQKAEKEEENGELSSFLHFDSHIP